METINAMDALTPYIGGCSYYAESYNIRNYCINMARKKNLMGTEKIFLEQDFFSCRGSIDSTWKADVDGNTILLYAPFEESIKVEVVDPETKIIPTVEWKPELKALNFVNRELWEEDLVREIVGVTYYPLNLFKFKDRLAVIKSPQVQGFIEYLDIRWKRYTKTLYYYIKDGRLYIGLWNYELRMPEDPLRLCEIDEKYCHI